MNLKIMIIICLILVIVFSISYYFHVQIDKINKIIKPVYKKNMQLENDTLELRKKIDAMNTIHTMDTMHTLNTKPLIFKNDSPMVSPSYFSEIKNMGEHSIRYSEIPDQVANILKQKLKSSNEKNNLYLSSSSNDKLFKNSVNETCDNYAGAHLETADISKYVSEYDSNKNSSKIFLSSDKNKSRDKHAITPHKSTSSGKNISPRNSKNISASSISSASKLSTSTSTSKSSTSRSNKFFKHNIPSAEVIADSISDSNISKILETFNDN